MVDKNTGKKIEQIEELEELKELEELEEEWRINSDKMRRMKS